MSRDGAVSCKVPPRVVGKLLLHPAIPPNWGSDEPQRPRSAIDPEGGVNQSAMSGAISTDSGAEPAVFEVNVYPVASAP